MTPLEWVGAIVAVLVSVALMLLAFGYAADRLWGRIDAMIWRAAEKRIRERGTHMRSQSYWWETPEQKALWKACADHMADGNYPDASVIRDQTYARHLADIKARNA